MSRSTRNDSADLLAAVSAGNLTTVQRLLQDGSADVNVQDQFGDTPLHRACTRGNVEIVKLLLSHGANVNAQNLAGKVPLHDAAQHERNACIKLLLQRGADTTIRCNNNIQAGNCIIVNSPNVLSDFYDEGIILAETSIELEHGGEIQKEILLFNFAHLFLSTSPTTKRECSQFVAIVEAGHRRLLGHPLVEAFLHVQWTRVRSFYYIYLLLYFFFAALLAVHVFQIYRKYVWYLLLCCSAFLFLKELAQTAYAFKHGFPSLKEYFKSSENWLQWFTITSTFALLFPPYDGHCNPKWKCHVEAIAVPLAWTGMVFMIGRLPWLRIYAQMFTSVLKNFMLLLIAYGCLIMAFALSFRVLFSNRTNQRSLEDSLLSTLVMMTGEYEFSTLFHDPENPVYFNGTTQVVFIVFVFLISIVVMNLLVGLAVSDVDNMLKRAQIEGIVQQAKLIADIEYIIMSKWSDNLPCCNQVVQQLLRWLLRIWKPAFGKKKNPSCNKCKSTIVKLNPNETVKTPMMTRKSGWSLDGWSLQLDPGKKSSREILPKAVLKRAYELAKERRNKEAAGGSVTSITPSAVPDSGVIEDTVRLQLEPICKKIEALEDVLVRIEQKLSVDLPLSKSERSRRSLIPNQVTLLDLMGGQLTPIQKLPRVHFVRE